MQKTWLVAATVLVLSPMSGSAQKSNTQGFMANLHLNGASVTPPTPDGEDKETGSGGGAGVRLGWGFSPNFTIFGGFDVAKVSFDDLEDVGLGHADFAVIYNFGNSTRKLRPYVEIGYSLIALGKKETDAGVETELVQGGGGWVAGAGINYFMSRSAALNLGLDIGGAKFENLELNDVEQPGTEGNATTARLNFGLTWYPMKR